MNSYRKALEERKKQHLLRVLPLLPEGIDFCSNDYLGFARSTELHQKIEQEHKKIPLQNGATGSRLLSGNSEYAEVLEQKVADYHKAESALIYSSGYAANLGLISCLATRDTVLFCDELIHASLIDGARSGHSKRVRFNHNDVNDLSGKLAACEDQKIVIVESLYSMDGDFCPLEDMVEVCQKHDAMLIVDEAHSIGIYGAGGGGLVQQSGLEEKVMARIITYGKGPGIHGAAVVGPRWLRDYQINFSRSVIFSTAPATHHLASISAMYKYLPNADRARKNLQEVIEHFVTKRKISKGEWLNSNSQIQSLILPGNEQVMELGSTLQATGINALPIRKPSVAEGTERIRFCLHAYNTREEIALLFDALKGK